MRLRYEKCMNSRVFKEPLQKINEYYLLIDKYMKELENSELKKLKDYKLNMVEKISKLDALSPLKTLTRGYSIATNIETGKIIKKVSDVKPGNNIEIKVIDGKVEAVIKS